MLEAFIAEAKSMPGVVFERLDTYRHSLAAVEPLTTDPTHTGGATRGPGLFLLLTIGRYLAFFRHATQGRLPGPAGSGDLDALIDLRQRGMAGGAWLPARRHLREIGDDRRLTAYGTLYKALDRLAESGAIERRREDPEIAAVEGRPRRRYHRITLAGECRCAAA